MQQLACVTAEHGETHSYLQLLFTAAVEQLTYDMGRLSFLSAVQNRVSVYICFAYVMCPLIFNEQLCTFGCICYKVLM